MYDVALPSHVAHTDHPLRHFDRTCPACLKEGEERFDKWSPPSTAATSGSGPYRWIKDASDALKLWLEAAPPAADGAMARLMGETDSLLSGVPVPPEDLGFDSPADRYARAWKALNETDFKKHGIAFGAAPSSTRAPRNNERLIGDLWEAASKEAPDYSAELTLYGLAAGALEDAARSATPATDVLRLCRAWLEKDEGRTLPEVIALEQRFNERGKEGYNKEYVALCKALVAATDGGGVVR